MAEIKFDGRQILPPENPQISYKSININPEGLTQPAQITPQQPSPTEYVYPQKPQEIKLPAPDYGQITFEGRQIMPRVSPKQEHIIISHKYPKGVISLPSQPVPISYEIERQQNMISSIDSQINLINKQKIETMQKINKQIYSIKTSPYDVVIVNDKTLTKPEAVKLLEKEKINISKKFDKNIESLQNVKPKIQKNISDLQFISGAPLYEVPEEIKTKVEVPKYTQIVYSPTGEIKGFTAPVESIQRFEEGLAEVRIRIKQPFEKEVESFIGKGGKTKAASFGLKALTMLPYMGIVSAGAVTVVKPDLADKILKGGLKATSFVTASSLYTLAPSKIAKFTKQYEIKYSPTTFIAERLPSSIKKTTAEFGIASYVAGSDILSFTAGVTALPNIVSSKLGKGNLYEPPKFLQRHYVSAFDVLFEPLGWSSQGSSRAFRSLMKHYPVGTVAGTAAGEAAIWLGTIGAGKAIGKGIKAISTNVKAIRAGSRAARAEKALGFSKSWQKSMAKITRQSYRAEARGVRKASMLVRQPPDYLYIPVESEATLPEGIGGKVVTRGGKKWIRFKYSGEGKIRYHISQEELLKEWSKPRYRKYIKEISPTKTTEIEHIVTGDKFNIKFNIEPHPYTLSKKLMTTETKFTGIYGKLFKRARATQIHYAGISTYERGSELVSVINRDIGRMGGGVQRGITAGGEVVSGATGKGGGLVSKMAQRVSSLSIESIAPKVIFGTSVREAQNAALLLAGSISSLTRAASSNISQDISYLSSNISQMSILSPAISPAISSSISSNISVEMPSLSTVLIPKSLSDERAVTKVKVSPAIQIGEISMSYLSNLYEIQGKEKTALKPLYSEVIGSISNIKRDIIMNNRYFKNYSFDFLFSRALYPLSEREIFTAPTKVNLIPARTSILETERKVSPYTPLKEYSIQRQIFANESKVTPFNIRKLFENVIQREGFLPVGDIYTPTIHIPKSDISNILIPDVYIYQPSPTDIVVDFKQITDTISDIFTEPIYNPPPPPPPEIPYPYIDTSTRIIRIRFPSEKKKKKKKPQRRKIYKYIPPRQRHFNIGEIMHIEQFKPKFYNEISNNILRGLKVWEGRLKG